MRAAKFKELLFIFPPIAIVIAARVLSCRRLRRLFGRRDRLGPVLDAISTLARPHNAARRFKRQHQSAAPTKPSPCLGGVDPARADPARCDRAGGYPWRLNT